METRFRFGRFYFRLDEAERAFRNGEGARNIAHWMDELIGFGYANFNPDTQEYDVSRDYAGMVQFMKSWYLTEKKT